MAQTIWKGWLSFGLVNIPVRLHRVVEEKTVRFREIDRDSGARVRHRRVTETRTDGPDLEEQEPPRPTREPAVPYAEDHRGSSEPEEPREDVSFDQVLKGFELPSGELVTLTREELWEIRPEQTHTIEIIEFVDLAEIDPVFFDRSYYVVPQSEPGAGRAYGLLLEAMSRAGRIGVGSFVLRTREHVAAIRPVNGAIGLATLHYGDEIRAPADVGYDPVPSGAPDREVKLAEKLIGALATAWDPDRHRDAYRARVLELIDEKASSGATIQPPEPSRETGATIDLMAALKASVEAIGGENRRQRTTRRTG